MPDDEAKLVERLKAGDAAAFEELYDRCRPLIYRFILYRVGDATVAEDLTSEVFVRMVSKIDRYYYRGRPILAWLYTIARNLVADYSRRAGRPLPVDPRGKTVADPEEELERNWSRDQLVAALSSLTEDQRQVVLLRFVEDMDNETVARLLNKPVGAIKSLQHRALASLRRLLREPSSPPLAGGAAGAKRKSTKT